MIIYIIGVACVVVLLFVVNYLLSPKPLVLEGSHVVITGGSSGIGKCLAIEVVKRGASVTIIARKQNILKEAKDEIEKHIKDPSQQRVLCLSLDLTSDEATVIREIKKAEDQLGPTDMLVNCAGFSISDDFEKLTMSEFRQLMDVNFFGSVSPTKAVIGGMKSRGRGRIVFVSSQAGQVGIFGFTAYSASKFALRGMAEALQMELKPYNIYVTLAFPPDTDTPGYKEEMIRKPKETHLISETSGLFQPQTVAKTILRDARKGYFFSSMGLDGFLLSNLTGGMSPVVSVLDAAVQVSLATIFRAVSFFYLWMFDRIIRKCYLEKSQEKSKQM